MNISRLLLLSPVFGIIAGIGSQYVPNVLSVDSDINKILNLISFLIVGKLLIYTCCDILFLIGIVRIAFNSKKQTADEMYLTWAVAIASVFFMGFFGLVLLIATGVLNYHQRNTMAVKIQ